LDSSVTRFIGFDLETTGIDSFSDVPVSYGFVERIDGDRGRESLMESGYVNPGIPIPAGACAVHGITDEMVEDAMGLLDAVELMAERVAAHWADGDVIVGMNVAYDLTMLDSLCRRLELATLAERGDIGAVIDVLVLDRHFDKWRKGGRKLTDLCRHYEVNLGNAHSAAHDAEASLAVFEKLRQRYPAFDAVPVAQLNITVRSWYHEWLSSFSLYLEKKGENPIPPGRYEWPIHVDDDAVVGLGRFELPISRPPAERSRPN
jgi:DNA polymerase-3 subunit epsilon